MRSPNFLLSFAYAVAVLPVFSSGQTATSKGSVTEAEELLGKGVSIPTYHAFIVGINDYKHWQDLRQAKDDAQAVARELGRRYGFAANNITQLYDSDATRDAINLRLQRYAKALTENDALLIYYSGHGFYDKITKKGYWIPSEARETFGGEPAGGDWIHNTQLSRTMWPA